MAKSKNVAEIARQVIIEDAERDGFLDESLKVAYGDLDVLHTIANRAGLKGPPGRPNYFVTLRVLDHLDRHCKRPDSMFIKCYLNINRGVGGRMFYLKSAHHPRGVKSKWEK